jgi:methylglutaconyl-CoA hydratase
VGFAADQNDCDEFVEHTLKLILAAAPDAVKQTKALHQFYSPIKWKTVRTKVTKLIAQRRVGAEGQTGLQAFLEKKTPVWSETGYGAPPKI